MTFISYAQNFEDVILWRALKHVERGFYIDVGAAWPDADSVTKAFYERGWQGINIEPNPDLLARCVAERERDINLGVALSDHAGQEEMMFIPDSGLSSLCKSIVEQHQRAGWTVERAVVDVTTLADVWEKYAFNREVHFVKIDVEGSEEKVLRGNDWKRFRPWILVVEATAPNTPQANYEQWEDVLTAAGYAFAYFDGLNRFYIAREHPELRPAFATPPNFFDRFVIHNDPERIRADAAEQREAEARNRVMAEAEKVRELSRALHAMEVKAAGADAIARAAEIRAIQLAERAAAAESLAREAQASAERAQAHAAEALIRAERAENRVQAILNSVTWRATEPARWLVSAMYRIACRSARAAARKGREAE